MRKLISLAAVLLLCAASFAAVTEVYTYSQLVNAVSYSSDTIRLTADITYGDADGVLYVPAKATRVIDLDLHTLQRNVTNSSTTIRPTITLGRNANLTLVNGNVVCNNTLVDASLQPCAVYLPAEGAVLNLEQMTLIAFMNGNHAANAYGVLMGEQDNLTVNARISNINGLYLKNGTYTHTLNLYRVNAGSAARKNSNGLGLKADNGSHLQGAYAMGEVHGANLTGAQLLKLIPDEDMKYLDWNNPDTYTELTRSQIAQMASLENQSLYFFPDLNFTVGNKSVTYTNCDDILGDGTARFDFRTNTLYLKNSDPNNAKTLSGIYWTSFDLTVDVEGKWRSTQIESYDGNLTVRGHHHALTAEDADLLLVVYTADEPFAIHGADIKFENRIRIYAESDRQTDPVFTCHNITVDNSWVDAFGKKPIANCSYYFVTNASYKAGSFRNHDVLQIEPEFTQYYIFVQSNGKDRGTLSGEGWYNEGAQATISATPNEGYYFDRWYEDGCTDATRTVTVTESTNYTALFFPEVVVNYYDINVVSADESMGTVSGGALQVEEGQTVTIKATPKDGYKFRFWTNTKNEAFSTEETVQVTATANETYTAHFRAIPDPSNYNLWLCGTQVSASNADDVLGDGVWNYDAATNTLTTMKKATYNLTDKNFVLNAINKPLTIVLNHSVTINASTTDIYHEAVIDCTYGVIITGTPVKRLAINCTDMYAIYTSLGTAVINGPLQVELTQTITAWGEENIKHFMLRLKNTEGGLTVHAADVYMDIEGTSNFAISNLTNDQLDLTEASIVTGSMTDNAQLYISSDAVRYQVHYSNGDLVDICPVYGFGFYYPGQIVSLEARPKQGYIFVGWSDGNTDNPRVLTMPNENIFLDPIVEEDESLAPKGAIINANATEGQGFIEGFESGWYAEGTVLSITAVPADHYEFVEWSDGVTFNPYVLTVEDGKNISITAVFRDTSSDIQEGFEQVQRDNVQCTKVLRDGQLLIDRNGKTFTAIGAEVK